MAATARELATSPLAIPPMPSHTTKMPRDSSKPRKSSLLVRTQPISLSAETMMRIGVGVAGRENSAFTMTPAGTVEACSLLG